MPSNRVTWTYSTTSMLLLLHSRLLPSRGQAQRTTPTCRPHTAASPAVVPLSWPSCHSGSLCCSHTHLKHIQLLVTAGPNQPQCNRVQVNDYHYYSGSDYQFPRLEKSHPKTHACSEMAPLKPIAQGSKQRLTPVGRCIHSTPSSPTLTLACQHIKLSNVYV